MIPLPFRAAAALATAAAIFVLPACDRRPSPTIHDAAFIHDANALCGRELPSLRAQKHESDIMGKTDKNDRAKTAEQVEKVADGLDDVAAKLGNLPVRPADQAEVAGWLEEWANFTGVGRQYATAIRTERASVYTSIAAEGNGPVQRIARFARANRMDKCLL